ncbi:hypothetical protein, partial [Methylomonas lenta]|uniref:hypothetical protein n=1 Tax=Methylomonas lenta TaxID=980561 RepID=UPI001E2B0140
MPLFSINANGDRQYLPLMPNAPPPVVNVRFFRILYFPLKGQGIYAYVTLNHGVKGTDELKQALADLRWLRLLGMFFMACSRPNQAIELMVLRKRVSASTK